MPTTGTPIGLPGPPTFPSLTYQADGKTISSEWPIRFTHKVPDDGAATAAATPPATFDWDKADGLLEVMGMNQQGVIRHRSKISDSVKAIKQLTTPWADASTEERAEVERTLRRSTSQGGMPFLRAEEFPGEVVEQAQRLPFTDDEKRYEELRLARLLAECQSLETALNSSNSALNALARHWEQYQGAVTDLELHKKEAELMLQAATEVYAIIREQIKAGQLDSIEEINANVSIERAKISRDRAANHLIQMQTIGQKHPQLEPGQYHEELDGWQKLLTKVREENPDMKPLPAPAGVGGGFF